MRREMLLIILKKAREAYLGYYKSCPFCALAELRRKRWLKTNDYSSSGLHSYCREHEIAPCCCFCQLNGREIETPDGKKEYTCVLTGKRLLAEMEKGG